MTTIAYNDVGLVVPLHPLEVSGQVFIQEPDRSNSGTDVPFEIFSDYSDIESLDVDSSTSRSCRQFRMRIRALKLYGRIVDMIEQNTRYDSRPAAEFSNSFDTYLPQSTLTNNEYATTDMGMDFLGRYTFWTYPSITSSTEHELGMVIQSQTAYVGVGTVNPRNQIEISKYATGDSSVDDYPGSGSLGIRNAVGNQTATNPTDVGYNPHIQFYTHQAQWGVALEGDDASGGTIKDGRRDWQIGVESSGKKEMGDLFVIRTAMESSETVAMTINETSVAFGGGITDGVSFNIGSQQNSGNSGVLQITSGEEPTFDFTRVGSSNTTNASNPLIYNGYKGGASTITMYSHNYLDSVANNYYAGKTVINMSSPVDAANPQGLEPKINFTLDEDPVLTIDSTGFLGVGTEYPESAIQIGQKTNGWIDYDVTYDTASAVTMIHPYDAARPADGTRIPGFVIAKGNSNKLVKSSIDLYYPVGSNAQAAAHNGSGLSISVENNAGNGGEIVAGFSRDPTNTTGFVEIFGDLHARGTITSTSDIRLKENVVEVQDNLQKIEKLKTVSFNFIDRPDSTSLGLIAQEVRETLPEVVRENGGMLSLDYNGIVATLLGAVRELTERVKFLENKK